MRSDPHAEIENDVVPSPNIATSLNQITPTPISTGDISMSTNNTTTAPAATITEKELFAEFLEMELPANKNLFGGAVRTYRPDNWLRDPGENGTLGLFVDDLTDKIAASYTPDEDLECFIADVRQWLKLADEALDDFRELKAVRMPDEADADLTRQVDFIAMKPQDNAIIRGEDPCEKANELMAKAIENLNKRQTKGRA